MASYVKVYMVKVDQREFHFKVEFSKMTYNNYNLIDCNKEIKAASCTASSEHSGGYGACEKANDGKLDTNWVTMAEGCLLYTSPSPRDGLLSRMPSSA